MYTEATASHLILLPSLLDFHHSALLLLQYSESISGSPDSPASPQCSTLRSDGSGSLPGHLSHSSTVATILSFCHSAPWGICNNTNSLKS